MASNEQSKELQQVFCPVCSGVHEVPATYDMETLCIPCPYCGNKDCQ